MFLNLTLKTGDKVLVNSDHISHILPDILPDDKKVTLIYMMSVKALGYSTGAASNSRSIYVKESVDDIYNLLTKSTNN